MKSKIAFLYLYLLCQAITAQSWYEDPQSYEGVVMLADRSTKRGVFSYNQSEECLLFDNSDKISTGQALYFQFYSPQEKNNRYFFSHTSVDGHLRFFELLLNGRIPLYKKSVLIKKDYIDSHSSQMTFHIDKKIMEDRLYFNHNDTIMAVSDFETQILPLMKNQIKSVSVFILSKQLDFDLTLDQLLIIDHYNNLFK